MNRINFRLFCIKYYFQNHFDFSDFVSWICLQMDPKFLRNQRYAKKHNNKSGETASEEE